MNITHTPSVDLLPCPICGKSAELISPPFNLASFVVLCQDVSCDASGVRSLNDVFDTEEEACAAWNEWTACSEFCSCRCPNCGWSESDGHPDDFDDIPESPRWKRILRRVSRWFSFSDLYLFAVVFYLFWAFDSILHSQGIESGFTSLYLFLFSAIIYVSVPIACRAVFDVLQTYIRHREFIEYLNSTTTPTTTTQGEKS